jgi:hypothetical protein
MEFYRTATSLLPAAHTISPDFLPNGYLDFYINGDLNWGQGDREEDHARRFAKGGLYHILREHMTQYGFCPPFLSHSDQDEDRPQWLCLGLPSSISAHVKRSHTGTQRELLVCPVQQKLLQDDRAAPWLQGPSYHPDGCSRSPCREPRLQTSTTPPHLAHSATDRVTCLCLMALFSRQISPTVDGQEKGTEQGREESSGARSQARTSRRGGPGSLEPRRRRQGLASQHLNSVGRRQCRHWLRGFRAAFSRITARTKYALEDGS